MAGAFRWIQPLTRSVGTGGAALVALPPVSPGAPAVISSIKLAGAAERPPPARLPLIAPIVRRVEAAPVSILTVPGVGPLPERPPRLYPSVVPPTVVRYAARPRRLPPGLEIAPGLSSAPGLRVNPALGRARTLRLLAGS